MPFEIIMPRLSDSMEEGTILHWLVAEGDEVKEGEPLVEVETDKASVTYESEHDGVLLRIEAAEGESAAVGAVIAVIGTAGESGSSASVGSSASAESSASAGSLATAEASGSGGPVATAPPSAPTRPSTAGGSSAHRSAGRVKASPLARRIASELGVDLATLVGTGPQGRVVRVDVERSAAGRPGDGGAAVATPAAAAAEHTRTAAPAGAVETPRAVEAVGAAKGEVSREELGRRQQTIARRMAESRATVPDFELRVEVDMTEAVELRERLREVMEPAPTFNDLIVKAVGLALREHSHVNAAYRDGAVERYSRVNVGIAVAIADSLIVPTIFDADTRPLAAIAQAARTLAARAREGSITPAELSGGTFSVSNLGMFGIDSFTAIVNPPQAAILAVGSLRRRPVVADDGALVARETVNLTLACDHRALYGADAARFLARVRELLERPLALLVG